MPRPARDSDDRNSATGPHMIRPTFSGKRRLVKLEKPLDYKDVSTLKKFTNDVGKIVGRKKTGLCGKDQRAAALAIKRSRYMALMPYTVKVD